MALKTNLIPPDLKRVFQDADEDTIARKDLARLVQYTLSIAEVYFKQRWHSLGYLYQFAGLTARDLASECVADLFAMDDQRNFFRLKEFICSLHRPLEATPEHEVDLALRAFVRRLAKKRISELFLEIDPAGAKIYRNIRIGLTKVSALELRKDLRGYVIQPRKGDLLDDREAFPLHRLANQLLAISPKISNIVVLLRHLARVLSEQEEFRRSVPLFDVVQTFKLLHVRLNDEGAFGTLCLPGEIQGNLDLEMMEDTIRAVQKKIITRYIVERKIGQEEAEQLSNTLRDVIAGWRNGVGSKGEGGVSLFQYARRHLGCSEAEYRTRWRVKLEYLTRLAREHVLLCLDGEL